MYDYFEFPKLAIEDEEMVVYYLQEYVQNKHDAWREK